MWSGVEGSSANAKWSDQPFLCYLIGYENQLSYMVFIANQITHEWLIRSFRVGRGSLNSWSHLSSQIFSDFYLIYFSRYDKKSKTSGPSHNNTTQTYILQEIGELSLLCHQYCITSNEDVTHTWSVIYTRSSLFCLLKGCNKIPAYQLRKLKILWVIQEYGLSGVWVKRVLTVLNFIM